MGKIALIIAIVVTVCFYIYNNIIKPYKEKVDYINDKIDFMEDFVNDKLDIIDRYNPFS